MEMKRTEVTVNVEKKRNTCKTYNSQRMRISQAETKNNIKLCLKSTWTNITYLGKGKSYVTVEVHFGNKFCTMQVVREND